jgi:hypothetical protein
LSDSQFFCFYQKTRKINQKFRKKSLEDKENIIYKTLYLFKHFKTNRTYQNFPVYFSPVSRIAPVSPTYEQLDDLIDVLVVSGG